MKEGLIMPEVTRFYGIAIQIRFNREHNPPHFHAIYGEKEGAFDIKTLEMIQGNLSTKAQSLVKEWANKYQNELMQMWNTKQLQKLMPLD
jgi:hypothetical protein